MRSSARGPGQSPLLCCVLSLMLDQDGARINARALSSSPDRSVLRSKAAQPSSLTPLASLRLQCVAVSVRSVLHPLEQQKSFSSLKFFSSRHFCLHVSCHSSGCAPYWYEVFPASPLPPPLAEFSTLQSIRPHTVVEPLVVQPRLTGSGLAASQKGLYWCAVGLALVSTPGPYGS